jgi:5-methylcytosine-specific restriction endonuclease McrA
VVRFTADEALLKKLERLKEVLSHQLPAQDMNALLHKLADIALKHADPARKTPSKKPTAPAQWNEAPQSGNPRYIPQKMRAALFAKAQHQCEYKDQATDRRCAARHYLQIDHVTPVARGGKANAANLRVLCGEHNRFIALQHDLPLPSKNRSQSLGPAVYSPS